MSSSFERLNSSPALSRNNNNLNESSPIRQSHNRETNTFNSTDPMRKQHLDLLGQSLIPSTIDIMNRAAYDASEAGLTEELSALDASMLKLLRIKEHLALVSAEYARFSSTNPSATGDLEILLQRQKPEDIRIRKSTNADYRSFKETIWDARDDGTSVMPPISDDSQDDHEEEEDAMIQVSRPSLRCPLTQQHLVDPVRNQPCGHVYSRAAILALLQQQQHHNRAGNQPCPIAGCSARISGVAALQPATDLAGRIERMANRIFN